MLPKIKNIRFNIFAGLLAMYVAWFLGYVFHAVYKIHFLSDGPINDFLFLLFWSAIYCLIALVVFVPLVVWLSNRINRTRPPFLLVSTIAGPVALFLISLVWLRLYPNSMGLGIYLQSLVVSLSFGFLYPLAYRLKDFINGWLYKCIAIAFPIVSLILLFHVIPLVFPRIAYCYFGDPIRERGLEHMIRNIEVGDDVTKLNKKIPGFFDNFIEGSPGTKSGSRETFEYAIKIERYKIKSVQLKRKDN